MNDNNQTRDHESAAYDIAEALDGLPKTEAEREAYDRVKGLAVEFEGTEDMDEHGAIDIVYELIRQVEGGLDDPPDRDEAKAKAILGLVGKCKARTSEEYEAWLGTMGWSSELHAWTR